MENIGIQLYSYPSSMAFEEKLAHAAASGYAGVEFAGDYGGLAAPEMKAMLKKYGLWAKPLMFTLTASDRSCRILRKSA